MADTSNKATTQSDNTAQLMNALLGQDEIALAKGQQAIERGKLSLAEQTEKNKMIQLQMQLDEGRSRQQLQAGTQMAQTAAEREQMRNWDIRRGERELFMFEESWNRQEARRREERQNALQDAQNAWERMIALKRVEANAHLDQQNLMFETMMRNRDVQQRAEGVLGMLNDELENVAEETNILASIQQPTLDIAADTADHLASEGLYLLTPTVGGSARPGTDGSQRTNFMHEAVVSGAMRPDGTFDFQKAADLGAVLYEQDMGEHTHERKWYKTKGQEAESTREKAREMAPGLFPEQGRGRWREFGAQYLTPLGMDPFGWDNPEVADMKPAMAVGMLEMRFLHEIQGAATMDNADTQPIVGILEALQANETGDLDDEGLREALSSPEASRAVKILTTYYDSMSDALARIASGKPPVNVDEDEWREQWKVLPKNVREAHRENASAASQHMQAKMEKIRSMGVGSNLEARTEALDNLKAKIERNVPREELLASDAYKKLVELDPEFAGKLVEGYEVLTDDFLREERDRQVEDLREQTNERLDELLEAGRVDR